MYILFNVLVLLKFHFKTYKQNGILALNYYAILHIKRIRSYIHTIYMYNQPSLRNTRHCITHIFRALYLLDSVSFELVISIKGAPTFTSRYYGT